MSEALINVLAEIRDELKRIATVLESKHKKNACGFTDIGTSGRLLSCPLEAGHAGGHKPGPEVARCEARYTHCTVPPLNPEDAPRCEKPANHIGEVHRSGEASWW